MANVCDECSLRLYNDKCHDLSGVGDWTKGNAIVVPNVDKKAYKNKDFSFSQQVDILNDVFISSTGGIATDFAFIVPLIRCSKRGNSEITFDNIERCSRKFMEDINRHSIKNILYLGSFIRCLNDSPKCYMCNDTLIYYSHSPFVKYTNEKLFEELKYDIETFYKLCNERVNL